MRFRCCRFAAAAALQLLFFLLTYVNKTRARGAIVDLFLLGVSWRVQTFYFASTFGDSRMQFGIRIICRLLFYDRPGLDEMEAEVGCG